VILVVQAWLFNCQMEDFMLFRWLNGEGLVQACRVDEWKLQGLVAVAYCTTSVDLLGGSSEGHTRKSQVKNEKERQKR